MKDFLQDVVSHTHSLGVVPIIRMTATAEKTVVDAVSEDRVLLLTGTTHKPIANLIGVFGMPNLNKLDLHLKCPEYQTDAVITVTTETRDGEALPTGIHFENAAGDYRNDYRFMSRMIVDRKFKDAEFLGTKWDVEFQPTVANIQRLKFQAAAHTEETVFQTSVKDGNLIISFGDLNTHAGNFIFQSNITGHMRKEWLWPKSLVLSVLNLTGDKTVKLHDGGALQIVVDSGIAEYKYTFKAQQR
jgi:hypothetical protein